VIVWTAIAVACVVVWILWSFDVRRIRVFDVETLIADHKMSLALVDEVRGIAHTSQFNITQATPVTRHLAASDADLHRF